MPDTRIVRLGTAPEEKPWSFAVGSSVSTISPDSPSAAAATPELSGRSRMRRHLQLAGARRWLLPGGAGCAPPSASSAAYMQAPRRSAQRSDGGTLAYMDAGGYAAAPDAPAAGGRSSNLTHRAATPAPLSVAAVADSGGI